MARLQTKALFFETTLPEYRLEMEPEWTLKEKDHLANDGKLYRSMKKIFLEMEDVTEYEFALATLVLSHTGKHCASLRGSKNTLINGAKN